MLCAGGLAVICLSGCGKATADSPITPIQEEQQDNLVDGVDNNAAGDGASDSKGNGTFFDGANLQGSVVEFSDKGFSLNP